MGSIKAKYSSVELFFDKCSTEYPIVLNIANEILRQVEQMLYEAERDKQKLRSQIIKLKAMQDGLSSKSMRCSAMISEAQSECQCYSREMEYIQSHPIPTTKTDSDGNEYTEMVVDEAAYRAASRNQMEASSTLSLQMSKQYDIEEVGDRIKDKIEDFEWTYKGIELIIKNLETCVYEIKKTISAMEYEADYNNTKFHEVLEALSAYLASKPIFMPSNAVYDVFANENITSASNNESSSSRVPSSMHDEALLDKNEAGDYTHTANNEDESTELYIDTRINDLSQGIVGLEKTRQTFTYNTLSDGSTERIFDHPNDSVLSATIDQTGACVIIDGKQYAGICALCDVTTLLNRAGVSVSLYDVVQYAVSNGICETYESIAERNANKVEELNRKLIKTTDLEEQQKIKSAIINLTNITPDRVGGISPNGAMNISQHFGLSGTAYSKTFMGTKPQFLRKAALSSLATCVENGQGVYISVRAGVGGYNPNGWYNGDSGGHALILNSVVRDAKTNNIKAFYIIDPNGQTPQQANIRISIDDLSSCFNVRAFITDKII